MKQVSLARRAARLSPTMPASGHDHAIPFDSGHGFPALFPDLTAAAEKALTTYRHETLQYGVRPGLPDLREWIAGAMNGDGASVTPDEIFVTNGAKQGIELVCRLLLDEGDSIVVTAPTYFTSIPIFRSFEADFIEVGQDSEGLNTDELAETLDRLKQDGRKMPKFVYNIPDFHNPTGVTMSRRRREALLELASRHGMYVVEDSPYRSVRFEGTSEASLKALDRSKNVLHLGTFSKLMAPGLRIGWVAGPPDLLARMIQLKADGGSSPLVQRIIVEWCKAGNLAAHTERVQRTYGLHRDHMVAALRRDLPEVSMAIPEGGYYLWLTLPHGIDADELAKHAADAGVTVLAGSKFYARVDRGNDVTSKKHMRLAYTHSSPEQIDEGIRRLAGAMRLCGVDMAAAPLERSVAHSHPTIA
jgi:2-aminoadipate transaminase